MTEGYTPSDITALCGAAVSAVHTERSTAIHRNRSAVEKMLKKGKADGTDVKGDSTKSSEVPLRALRIAVSTLTVRQTDRQTDRQTQIYILDRQTFRQTYIDGCTYRQADRHIDTHTPERGALLHSTSTTLSINSSLPDAISLHQSAALILLSRFPASLPHHFPFPSSRLSLLHHHFPLPFFQDIETAMRSVYPTAWAASSYGSLSEQQAQVLPALHCTALHCTAVGTVQPPSLPCKMHLWASSITTLILFITYQQNIISKYLMYNRTDGNHNPHRLVLTTQQQLQPMHR